MKSIYLAVAALLPLGACGSQDSINEVQYGLTSAATVARIAALSLDAIKGTTNVCASIKTACTSYPCNGAVTINLGAGCPLPLGGEASGTVEVTGSFSSADQATLSQTYTNARVSALSKELAVASVTQVTAQRSGSTINVSYSGARAVAAGSSTAAAIGASSSWDISVDTKSTPDPADDRFTVEASSASGSASGIASARATSLRGVVVDSSCRSNPTAGSADITEVSGFVPRIIKIQFHSACDGKAEVNGAATDLQLFP